MQRCERRHAIRTQAAQLAVQIDEALSTSEMDALKLLRQLRSEGALKGFGGGRQVPKRIYTLEEMRLNKVEPTALLSPTDDTLNGVRAVLQGSALAGVAALYFGLNLSGEQMGGLLVAGVFAYFADQIANGGGVQNLALDSIARIISKDYDRRVALHEAGHFLVAYLVGLPPKDYTLSAWSAYQRFRALNVQAGTQFCDGEFQAEVQSGRLSSSSLDRFSCIALAGVATEYLRFGKAEGGVGDVAQLDGLLRGLQFTQKKADGEVRWAVLNAVALLRTHEKAHDALAAAMQRGESVGACIELLERMLDSSELRAAEDGSSNE